MITPNLSGFSTVELLSALVGGKRKAQQLLAHAGNSLFSLLHREPAIGDLFAQESFSLYAVNPVAIAGELVARSLTEEMAGRDVLNSPTAVRQFLKLRLGALQFEAFHALFLDAQNRLIAAEELFRGTLTQTSVYPREVVKRALQHNCAGIILSHNHPSGVAEPSIQDQALTRALSESLSLVDVKVLDHIIVARNTTMSFAERGLI